MIKTTKTMLSKAWAICSAFKPEEALHNDRLNKTIEDHGTVEACSFGQAKSDRKFQVISTGKLTAEHAEVLNQFLEADDNTALGCKTKKGGAK